LSDLAHEFKILLIVDDIQAGCGRSGKFFSFERAGIKPDIVCLSKSIGGIGLPFSLLLFKPELDTWKTGEDNGTFRGNNLAFVASTTMINKYWKDADFETSLKAKSDVITLFCKNIMNRFPNSVSKVCGMGFMQGISFHDPADADAIVQECYANKLIIETCGANGETLKLMPALTIPDEVLNEGLGKLDASITACVSNYNEKETLEAVS